MRVVVQRVVDQGTTAVLVTDDHIEIRFPLVLLPSPVAVGDILDLDISHTKASIPEQVYAIQAALLEDS